MRYEVVLTKKVKRQLTELLEYLEGRFGTKAAAKLYQDFKIAIESLSQFPHFGNVVDGKGNRKCVLRGKSVLFYKVDLNVVRVLSLRDGRQDWKA